MNRCCLAGRSQLRLYQVDSFTQSPFTGNPAGVCLLASEQSAEWMLAVAREMNLSETAFLLRQGAGYSLRWFTPTTEVSLCGHATLASAHVLWEEQIVPEADTIEFYTKSGTLAVCRRAGMIDMDFPARQVTPVAHDDCIDQALGVAPSFTGKYSSTHGDAYLLRLDSEAAVRSVRPDFQKLLQSPARVVMVTSTSADPAYDFVSRFFAPAVGINEDPVTGSAHCYLIPYWKETLGKTEMLAYQASERGGTIRCTWKGDRVWIGGRAKTIFRGELLA